MYRDRTNSLSMFVNAETGLKRDVGKDIAGALPKKPAAARGVP
jgi:hypothetical protein